MAQTQTITLFVPGILRAHCGGASRLPIFAPDVSAALGQLEREHPALYRNLCDETGRVRQHLNVFVNADNVRFLQGLATRLAPGDVLTILPAVSGG